MSDGKVIIDTSLNNDGLEKDIKKLEKEFGKSTKSVDGLGKEFEKTEKKGKQAANGIQNEFRDLQTAIGDVASTLGLSFGLDSLLDLGSTAIETASDLQEVQNVVDTSFGEMSGQVENFASESIRQFGLSELAAKQTAGQYMSMTKSMGITGQAATDMALSVTGLTGDMASFYNVSQDVAKTALAAIWTGETESLKQFGIVMTQANLEAYALSEGINKTWSEMTQAEQVQLRYNYVMEQTALAQGDFAKTSDGWANQNRILDETIKSLSASIGEDLMNTLEPLLGVMVDIAEALVDFQKNTGLLDDFFVVLIGGISGLTAMKAADVIATVAAKVVALGEAALFAQAQAGLAAIGFGALVAVIVKLAGAWGYMSEGEKAVAVLGMVTAAALTAAIAVGAFHSAWSLGLAAAGIAAGIAAVMGAISKAEKTMDKYKNMDATPYAIPGTQRLPVPGLATGAVIPPNKQFLAMLGDQKTGRNLEAPEGLIRQIVREESGGGTPVDVNITFGGSLAALGRVLEPVVTAERDRRGESMTEGGAYA